MATINPLYLARERRRFMRPDAHRFIRPDWRRFVSAGSDLEALYEDFERKYSPDQPRVPAGSPDGGRWTSDGSSTTLSAAKKKELQGHHYVSKGVYKKYPLPAETRKVLDQRTTGRLDDRRSNMYDDAHRAYNDAVREEMDKFLRENNINPEKMTPDEARVFLKKILDSSDPRIRNFNVGIWLREIRLRLLRALRNGE